MKNAFLLFFCLFYSPLTALLSAQSYLPLIQENKTWDIVVRSITFCGGDNPYDVCGYHRLHFEGDSLIGGVLYKKLYTSTLNQVTEGSGDFTISSPSIAGFMREEVGNQQVFILDEQNPCGPAEKLVFDFSLLQGEHLNTCYHFDSIDSLLIENVTSSVLNDGLPRKELQVESSYQQYYTEGIGGSAGMHQAFGSEFESDYSIMCVQKDGASILGSGWTDYYGCPNIVTGNRDIPSISHKILLAPNPAQILLNVELTTRLLATESQVNVYTATGALVLQAQEDSPSFQISVENLADGVYWLEVKNGAGVGVKRFVKF